jgi:hypothetical protein
MIWEFTKRHTYTIATVKHESRKALTRALATVKIRLDQKSVIFGRVSESLLKALEEIGGFLESMMIIGTIMVLFFQKRLFKGAFIKELYQVNDEPKTE